MWLLSLAVPPGRKKSRNIGTQDIDALTKIEKALKPFNYSESCYTFPLVSTEACQRVRHAYPVAPFTYHEKKVPHFSGHDVELEAAKECFIMFCTPGNSSNPLSTTNKLSVIIIHQSIEV